MNYRVLGIMIGTATTFFGLVIYAIVDTHPWLLAALAVVATLAFSPW